MKTEVKCQYLVITNTISFFVLISVSQISFKEKCYNEGLVNQCNTSVLLKMWTWWSCVMSSCIIKVFFGACLGRSWTWRPAGAVLWPSARCCGPSWPSWSGSPRCSHASPCLYRRWSISSSKHGPGSSRRRKRRRRSLRQSQHVRANENARGGWCGKIYNLTDVFRMARSLTTSSHFENWREVFFLANQSYFPKCCTK